MLFWPGAKPTWRPRANASRFAVSTNGEALESERLKARLGEMLLERELLEASEIASDLREVAALEAGRPLALRRSKR